MRWWIPLTVICLVSPVALSAPSDEEVQAALETGLVQAQGDTSTFRVLTLNTDMACDITVQTPLQTATNGGNVRRMPNSHSRPDARRDTPAITATALRQPA